MERKRLIDIESHNDDRGFPVHETDEEIILVGEKRKIPNPSHHVDEKIKNFLLLGRESKRRKIELDDDNGVDPLYLSEEKEREFQHIRQEFPTTDPLVFLTFDIIEHICHYLLPKDFLHLLCLSKLWSSCREILPWKDLCARLGDVKVLNKCKGTWLERFKFKRALDLNWKYGTQVEREFKINCAKFIQLRAETIIYETHFAEEISSFYKVVGPKTEEIFVVAYSLTQKTFGTNSSMFVTPVHVFEADNKILGIYESDREWVRQSNRTISKWILAESDSRQVHVSLDHIFDKTVKLTKLEELVLYGNAMHVESDVMVSYSGARSTFIIDKISTMEQILETKPLTVPSSTFYHINGDFILYRSQDLQLMILNWQTNELSNIEVTTNGIDNVALTLPNGAIDNSGCAYSLYADTDWLILINLTSGIVVRHYEKPSMRFKPIILKLWPDDKTKFFTIGSTLHIWSLYKSYIVDSILVHPVHPRGTVDPIPLQVKFHDNKLLVRYATRTYILMKNDAGLWDSVQRFSSISKFVDFDESRIYLRDQMSFESNSVTVTDFSPNESSTVTNNNVIVGD